MRSIHHLPILAAALALAACASEDATFIRQNGAMPDPKVFEADAHDCHKVGKSSSGIFANALGGASAGFYGGAQDSNNPLGAIAGASVGAVLGLFFGAINDAPGDNYNLCMARKGYQMVDTEQAAAE